jgi:hypothetical protein
MDVAGHKLKVTKASIGPTQIANFDVGITAISSLASQASGEAEKSRVLQLLNMVTAEELMDNDDYEGKKKHGTFGFVSPRADLWQKFARMSRRNAPSSAQLLI